MTSFYIDTNINQQSLNVSTIVQTDSNITINDLGSAGKIQLNVDNQSVQEWKSTYTQVMNELRTGNIKMLVTSLAGGIELTGSSYPSIFIKDQNNVNDSLCLMRDHPTNRSIFRCTGRIDIETPPNYPRMTFLGGNIGIGTTSPSTTLDVNGVTTIRGDILPSVTATYNLGSNAIRMGSLFTTNITSTNALVTPSDINIKKDIQLIENGLSVVMNLKPKSYKLIEDNLGQIHTGFIAQEVKDLFCENWAVYSNNQGSIGLKYEELIALNTSAIQELNNKITNLEKQNQKLSEIINMLLRFNNFSPML